MTTSPTTEPSEEAFLIETRSTFLKADDARKAVTRLLGIIERNEWRDHCAAPHLQFLHELQHDETPNLVIPTPGGSIVDWAGSELAATRAALRAAAKVREQGTG